MKTLLTSKRSSFNPFALALVGLLATSCSKNEVVVPSSSGNGLPDPVTSGTFDFTLDGVAHHMLAPFAVLPSAPSALYTITVGGSTTAGSVNVTLSTDSLGPQTLHSPFAGVQGFGFVWADMAAGGNAYMSDMYSSIGILEFTQLDTASGGLVEGTFSVSGVQLYDVQHTIIPGTHTVTNGSFSIPVTH